MIYLYYSILNKLDFIIANDILAVTKVMRADGIEANYIYINSKNEVIDEVLFLNNFAILNNLRVTTGSDFHFSDALHLEIGLGDYEFNYSDVIEYIEKD